MTDLPFAFAVWIARPDFPQSEISKLNEALSIGVEDLELLPCRPIIDRIYFIHLCPKSGVLHIFKC